MQELDEEIDDIHNQIHALEVKWEEAMLFEEARKSSQTILVKCCIIDYGFFI